MAKVRKGIVGGKYKVIGTPYQGTHTLGNWQSDNAVDLAMPVGTPLYAAADGVIGPGVGSLGRGGQFAGLRFTLVGKQVSFWYGHLSKLAVKAGQKVKKGQLVGYSGSANGVAHLHFAVYTGNNPANFVQFGQPVSVSGAPAPTGRPSIGKGPPTESVMEPRGLNITPPTAPGQPGFDQEVPGSVQMPYEPLDAVATWQRLAADPIASPETRRIAQRLGSGTQNLDAS